MRALIIPLAFTLLAGPALAGAPRPAPIDAKSEADLNKLLAGRTAGKPVSCLPNSSNMRIQQFGERTLIYSDVGRTIWRNDPPGGCMGGGRGYAIITRTTTGSACRGDLATIVDQVSRIPFGSCALGDFTPYSLPQKGK